MTTKRFGVLISLFVLGCVGGGGGVETASCRCGDCSCYSVNGPHCKDSKCPVILDENSTEASWEDCGGGVLPNQTEVPDPMPAKKMFHAPTGLRLTEQDFWYDDLGLGHYTDEFLKRAAEAELSNLEKRVRKLESNVAADEEHKELRTVRKDPSIEFRPYKWRFDGTDGMIITFSLNSWGEKWFYVRVPEQWDVIRADGFLIDDGKRIDDDDGWTAPSVSLSQDENVLSSRHLRTRNFKSGKRYEIDAYLHTKRDREYYDNAPRP